MSNESSPQKSVITQNATGEISQYNAEQINIVKVVKGDYSMDGGFFVGFCQAMQEIASNRELKSLDMKLLVLILGFMGDKKITIEPNVQRLLGVADYAEILGYNRNQKSQITKSFKRLEEFGYIKRDKKRKDLHVLINPAVATNTSTKNFTKTWNYSAELFGNEPRKEKNSSKEVKEQDFSSDLPRQLAAKLKS